MPREPDAKAGSTAARTCASWSIGWCGSTTRPRPTRSATSIEFYEQGYSLVSSKEAQQAFDIHREAGKLREQYGRNSFGQRCLLARRLVEAGVPFITLYDGGWDHHTDLFDSFNKRMPGWDNSVATLIEDLDERGLLDIDAGDRPGRIRPHAADQQGRRPRPLVERDERAVRRRRTPGGQAIGATDSKGFAAIERVLSPENFVSTIYTKLGIDPDKMYYTHEGRPVHLVSDPTPIRELMG